MLNLDDIVSNKKNKDTSSSEGNIWPFRMLIIGSSSSGKTSTLLHLINNLRPIDKIYLYAKDTDEKKYQFLINKREQAAQSYFRTLKDARLNSTHYILMKIGSKK